MNKIEQLLTKLNLSPNEAKVYTGLLKVHPVNGYELSKSQGLTRATAYNVLDRLVEKGLATKIEGASVQYSPVPPDLFLRRYQADTDRTCEEILEEFKRLADEGGRETFISQIDGHEKIVQLTREILASATSEVVLSLWIQDARILLPQLSDLLQQGVKVIAFSYTDLSEVTVELSAHCDVAKHSLKLHHYGLSEDTACSLWSRRRLVIVADHTTALLAEATVDLGDLDSGILTRSPLVVQMCLEQINLDIMRKAHIEYELSSNGLDRDEMVDKEGFEATIKRLHDKLGLNSEDLPQVFLKL